MPKRWTEAEAVTLLESRGAETKDDFIILDGCCKGLTGGSALDYLLNNHNYRLGGEARMDREAQTCETCQKRRFNGSGCEVLTKAIGKSGSCSFWTDDQEWQNGIEEGVDNYRLYKGG